MASNGGVELRSVVKFFIALNKSPTKTPRMIESKGKYMINAAQLFFIPDTRLGAGKGINFRRFQKRPTGSRNLFH